MLCGGILIQPLLENDGGGNFIHVPFSVFPGHVVLQKGILRHDGGQPLILKKDCQAGLFQLSAEIPYLFGLKALAPVHIQGENGKNLVGFLAVA